MLIGLQWWWQGTGVYTPLTGKARVRSLVPERTVDSHMLTRTVLGLMVERTVDCRIPKRGVADLMTTHTVRRA